MIHILYNPLSANKRGSYFKDNIIRSLPKNDLCEVDCTKIDLNDFLSSLSYHDELHIIGGDGTLNRFVNAWMLNPIDIPCFMHAGGSGNDFLRDVHAKNGATLLNPFLKNIPYLEIDHTRRYFINNIGYGMDGMVCVVANRQKLAGKKHISYFRNALLQIAHDFTTRRAKITIDGSAHEFENVWLIPTMNGKYYGGGMEMAPNQSRQSDKLTLLAIHCPNRLKTLCCFPQIMRGQHIRHTDMIDIFTGNDIEVEFDSPCGLQYDGEVIENVLKYHAHKDRIHAA